MYQGGGWGGRAGGPCPHLLGIFRVKISKFLKISFFLLVVPPIKNLLPPTLILVNGHSQHHSDGTLGRLHEIVFWVLGNSRKMRLRQIEYKICLHLLSNFWQKNVQLVLNPFVCTADPEPETQVLYTSQKQPVILLRYIA